MTVRTASGVAGLHHMALVTRDLSKSADFYGRIVGLSTLGTGDVPVAPMDAPGSQRGATATWFGAGSGRPGSLIAVREERDAPIGFPGIAGSHHFALGVRDREALLMWKRRFLDEGYAVNGILDRHYFQSIYVKDPDGQVVEFATMGPGWTIDEEPDHIGEAHRDPPSEMINSNRDRARIAAENWPEAVRDIAPSMPITGLHHVSAIGADIDRTQRFVHDTLGMRRVKRTNNFDDVNSFHWYWGVGDGAPGTLVTYFNRSHERERAVRMGAGQLAHYAVGAETSALPALRAALEGAGARVSEVGTFGPASVRFEAVATHDPDGHPVVLAAV